MIVNDMTAPLPKPPITTDRNTPEISVIMSVYNGARYVGEAVESILAQTEKRFEFLIVNDGSSDDSPAILDRLAAKDARIKLFHQTNQGLIASLNFMVAQAEAPLLARMDADDISRPERFEKQLCFMKKNPQIAILGTNTDELDEHGTLMPCDDFYPLDPADMRRQLDHKVAMCHPSVMMRRDIIRAVGGYSPLYPHCEDYDLWLRVSEGHDITNLPDRLLLYRRSPGQISEQNLLTQATGACYARMAHRLRLAGKDDPLDGLDQLPPIEQFARDFPDRQLVRTLRAELINSVKYSRPVCRDQGITLMRAHLADGGDHSGYWRTVLRMVKMGLLIQAARLTWTLIITTKTSNKATSKTI